MSIRRMLIVLIGMSLLTFSQAREPQTVPDIDDAFERTTDSDCYVAQPEQIGDALRYMLKDHILVHSTQRESRCVVLDDLPFTGYYKVSVIALYTKNAANQSVEEYQLFVDDQPVGDIIPDPNNSTPIEGKLPDVEGKEDYDCVRHEHGYVFFDKENSTLHFETGVQYDPDGPKQINSVDFWSVEVVPPPHIIEEPEFTAGNSNTIEYKPLTDGVLTQEIYYFNNTGLAKSPVRSPMQQRSSTEGADYTVTFEGLLDGHQYGYYVEALLTNGQTVRSSTTYSTQDASPPSAVAIGSISSFANRLVYLKWNAATDAGSGVQYYEIIRSEDDGESTVSVVDKVWADDICTETGDFDYCFTDEIADVAMPNKVFTYRIDAVDNMGNVSSGVESDIVLEVPTPGLTTNPPLVDDLYYKGPAIKLSADIASLTQPEYHKIKFQVARDKQDFFDNEIGLGQHFFETEWIDIAQGDSLVEKEIDLTNNGENDLNFINGHTYFCRAQLKDLQDNFSAWSDILVVIPDCYVPSDISTLSVVPMTDSTNTDGWMQISWKGASDVVSSISQYYVYRKTSNEESFTCIKKTSDLFYEDNFDSINWNGHVTYRIGSEDNVGNIRTADLSQYEATARSQSAPLFSIVSGSIVEGDTIKSTTLRKIYVECKLDNFEDEENVKIVAKVNGVERNPFNDSSFDENTYRLMLPETFGLYNISVKALFPTKAVSLWSQEDQILLKDENAPGTSPVVKKQENFISANYPNPFNPSTNITYFLTNDSHVKVEVYNVQGRCIRSLTNEFQTEGSHSVLWNGANEAGHAVSSGIYYYKIEFEDQDLNTGSIIRRMLLIK